MIASLNLILVLLKEKKKAIKIVYIHQKDKDANYNPINTTLIIIKAIKKEEEDQKGQKIKRLY